MSWSATASGEFHEVLKTLRNLRVEGDQKAVELGHVEIAKEMALCAIDKNREIAVLFSVSLHGHTSDAQTFQVGANVSITKKPQGE